jgi:Zn-dependent protease with chaperone function
MAAGLYVLLAIALGCLGASIGDIVFTGDKTTALHFAATLNRCGLRFPFTNSMPLSVVHQHLAELDRCTSGAYRLEGIFVLAGAVALPLLTAGLMVAVPWLDWWRLRRMGQVPVPHDLSGRFGSLCDRAGLAGRRRPECVVGGLAVVEPFTTSRPGGGPVVVLPPAVAVAVNQPARFEPFVLHELAHVRAGDIRWAAAARGVAWVTIPAFVIGALPGLLSGGGAYIEGTTLSQAAIFVLATVLLADQLLRQRELTADRQASQWMGSATDLRHLLDAAAASAGVGARALVRLPMRLFSRHPSAAARSAALTSASGFGDGAFAYAFALGAVAAMAFTTSYYVADNFHQSQAGFVPERFAAGLGGVLLAVGLMPALLHRARLAQRTDIAVAWWQPVVGIAAGILAGALVSPGTAFGAAISLVVGEGWRGVILSLLLAGAGAGLTVLGAGLASLAVRAGGGAFGGWRQPTAVVVMCCSGALALLPLPDLSLSSVEWRYLTVVLPQDAWGWLWVLYPAAAIALALPAGWRALGWFVLTPVGAAALATAILVPGSGLPASAASAAVDRLAQEQQWAGALTGCAVLAVLAVTGGVSRLGRASVSAWLATFLVGTASTAYDLSIGAGHAASLFRFFAVRPSIWLFYLAGPIVCVALVRGRAAVTPGRAWIPAAAASTCALVVAGSVFGSGIPGLLLPAAAAQPTATRPATTAPAQPVAGTSPSPLSAESGHELTHAAELTITAAARRSLPSGWLTNAPPAPVSTRGISISPRRCAGLADATYLKMLAMPARVAQGDYHASAGLVVGTEELAVQVETFARPVSAGLLRAAALAVTGCHSYQAATPSGTLTFTARASTLPALAPYALETAYTIASASGRASLVTILISDGHNLVSVSQQTNVLGTTVPPPDAAAISRVLAAIVTGLRAAAGGTGQLSGGASPASAAGRPDVAGTWVGTYTCVQGLTGLRLQIRRTSGGALAATFSFFPVAANPAAARGSFAMSGTQAGSFVSLHPEHWISRPSGYVMSGLSGTVRAGQPPAFSGRLSYSACGGFSLHRS